MEVSQTPAQRCWVPGRSRAGPVASQQPLSHSPRQLTLCWSQHGPPGKPHGLVQLEARPWTGRSGCGGDGGGAQLPTRPPSTTRSALISRPTFSHFLLPSPTHPIPQAESGGPGALPGSPHGGGAPRAGSPAHGLSRLKAGTRKLAAKLGIHGKKDRGGSASSSPRAASPVAGSSPRAGGSPLAASPLAASPLAPSPLRPPLGDKPAPSMHPPPEAPAVGARGGFLLAPGTPEAVQVVAVGGMGGSMAAGARPAVTAAPRAAAGPAVVPPEGVPERDFSAAGPEAVGAGTFARRVLWGVLRWGLGWHEPGAAWQARRGMQ